MVKVRGRNSNGKTVKQTVKNGRKISGDDAARPAWVMVPGVSSSRLRPNSDQSRIWCRARPWLGCDSLNELTWVGFVVHRGYNPMVRVVWLNTSPRRRPRAVRPEGGVEGWCPAIPRGPLGCILLTTIMREKEFSVAGRLASSLIEWQTVRSLKITFSEWSLPASGSGWWPSSFLVEGVLRSKLQALPLTATRVVRARQAHLHSNWFRNTAGGKLPFTDRSRFDFPAMWYGIIPPMLVLCHTTWMTGRSLVHLVPEGQRSTERVWSINWWYGSIPHGASGLLIGPRHRNRHVTCGKRQSFFFFFFFEGGEREVWEVGKKTARKNGEGSVENVKQGDEEKKARTEEKQEERRRKKRKKRRQEEDKHVKHFFFVVSWVLFDKTVTECDARYMAQRKKFDVILRLLVDMISANEATQTRCIAVRCSSATSKTGKRFGWSFFFAVWRRCARSQLHMNSVVLVESQGNCALVRIARLQNFDRMDNMIFTVHLNRLIDENTPLEQSMIETCLQEAYKYQKVTKISCDIWSRFEASWLDCVRIDERDDDRSHRVSASCHHLTRADIDSGWSRISFFFLNSYQKLYWKHAMVEHTTKTTKERTDYAMDTN